MEDKIYITEDEFIALKLAMRNLQDDLEFSVKAHPDIIKNIIYPHGQKQIQDVLSIIDRVEKEQKEKAEAYKKKMEESCKKTAEYLKRREEQLRIAEENLRKINTNLDKIRSESKF